MKTIFGVFRKYDDARAAVDDLLVDKEFSSDELNVIAQADMAKHHLDIDMSRANIEATEMKEGLDQLLAGKHPIDLLDAGGVYAAGDIATGLTKTALNPGAAREGLKWSLVDFNIPEEVADAYVAGVKGGGVLLCVKTSDQRASEAANVLRLHKGDHVDSYV